MAKFIRVDKDICINTDRIVAIIDRSFDADSSEHFCDIYVQPIGLANPSQKNREKNFDYRDKFTVSGTLDDVIKRFDLDVV